MRGVWRRLWPYIAHTRPAAILPTSLAALTGYALVGPRTGVALWLDLGALVLIYGVLLWGGTNAWNTACDGESGALNLLRRPPPIPAGLGAFGIALKLSAVALALCYGPVLAGIVALCVVLSFAYSTHTPWWPRGKDVPGVDMAINGLGLGPLALMVGGGVAGPALTPELAVAGGAFFLAYFAGVPTTQIHQHEATSRDWASVIGPSRVLVLGAVLFLVHAVLVSLLGVPSAATDRMLWALWLLLTAAAVLHLLWWARTPRIRAYERMRKQMVLAMGAQVAFTAAIW